MILLIHDRNRTTAINMRNIAAISEADIYDFVGKVVMRNGTVIDTTDGKTHMFAVSHTKMIETIKSALATVEVKGVKNEPAN